MFRHTRQKIDIKEGKSKERGGGEQRKEKGREVKEQAKKQVTFFERQDKEGKEEEESK